MGIALNVPASNGVGTATNVTALDVSKTFELGGTFGVNETVVIEGTADTSGVNGWNGIASFNSPTGGTVAPQQAPLTPGGIFDASAQPIQCVVAFMRVRRVSPSTVAGSAPTVSVDSTTVATKNFAQLNVPAGSGVGTITDVSAFGTFLQFTVDGVFGSTEAVLVEATQDGVNFNTVAGFNSNYPQLSVLQGRYSQLRVRRTGVGVAQTIRVFLGACTNSGGSGSSGPNQALGSQTAWFIDGSNVSGLASNANDGKTAITPLLTRGEFYTRMAGVTITTTGNSGNGPTITLMSDLLAGDVVRSEIFTNEFAGFGLNWVGTPTQFFPNNPLTLDVYTAENPATGQVTLITCNNLPAANSWGTVIGQIVEQPQGGNVFARAIVIADNGGRQAWVSPPVNQNGAPTTFTVGLAINVWNPTKLPGSEVVVGNNVNYKYCQANTWEATCALAICNACIGGPVSYSGVFNWIAGAGIGIGNGSQSNCTSLGGEIRILGGRVRLIAAIGNCRIDASAVFVNRGVQSEMGIITTPGQGGTAANIVFQGANAGDTCFYFPLGTGHIYVDGLVYGTAVDPTLIEFDASDGFISFENQPNVTGGTDIKAVRSGITGKVAWVAFNEFIDYRNNNRVVGPVGPNVTDQTVRRNFALIAQGIMTENYPRECINAGTVLVSGTVYFMSLGLLAGDLITNIIINNFVAAAGTTQSLVAIHDVNGNRLAISNDLGAAWNAAGTIVNPLNAPFRIQSGGQYYASVFWTGTTGPTFGRTATLAQAAAVPGKAIPWGSQTGQVTIPNPITLATPAGTIACWIGVS